MLAKWCPLPTRRRSKEKDMLSFQFVRNLDENNIAIHTLFPGIVAPPSYFMTLTNSLVLPGIGEREQ